MTQTQVTVVRIYCSDKGGEHRDIIDWLHREHRVAGVTAFRGIAGFGHSGTLHEAGLLDISLELPVVVEFFDRPDKIEQVLALLADKVRPGHVVSWPASANLD
jgi:PII-like signaling protein